MTDFISIVAPATNQYASNLKTTHRRLQLWQNTCYLQLFEQTREVFMVLISALHQKFQMIPLTVAGIYRAYEAL